MALPVAPLGSLPSMNLSHGSTQFIEPAWHKALTAFLVNTAGSTGKDLVSNALARDYATAATAQGLPGATTPTTDTQSFWSKVLHGPEWDKERYEKATQLKREMARDQATEQYRKEQLGLEGRRVGQEELRTKLTASQQATEAERHRLELEERKRQHASEMQYRQQMENRLERALAAQTSQDAQKLALAEREFGQKAPLIGAQTAHTISQIASEAGKGSPYADAASKLLLASATLPPAEVDRLYPSAKAIIDQFQRDLASRRGVYDPMINKYLSMGQPGQPSQQIPTGQPDQNNPMVQAFLSGLRGQQP